MAEMNDLGDNFKSVVRLVTCSPFPFFGLYGGSDPKVSKGTGFFVSPTTIATAGHCVSGAESVTAINVNEKHIKVQRVYIHPTIDWALLSISETDKSDNYLEIDVGVQIGDAIFTLGNDDDQKYSLLSGSISRVDATGEDLNITKLQCANFNDHGSSGSPVIRVNDKKVIAIVTTSSKNISFFTRIDGVHAALKISMEDLGVQPYGDLGVRWELTKRAMCRVPSKDVRAPDFLVAKSLFLPTSRETMRVGPKPERHPEPKA